MNILLYLNGRLADLEPDENITIKKEFQQIEELETKEITYSYTVNLPFTEINNDIFGNAQNIDVRTKFNTIYDCQCYVNEVLVLNGKAILNEVDNESYKVNLYVEQKKEIKDVLGDRNMNEIIAHDVKINRWEDINDHNEKALKNDGSAHICFPYVLYNMPFNNYAELEKLEGDAKYYQSLNWDESDFALTNIYPSFNVLSVLKDMFKTEGYNLTGNIFNNEKFIGLWQTYQGSPELYNQVRQTPYYLRFNFNYRTINVVSQKNWNISSTLTQDTILNGLPVGFDTINLSENTSMSNIVNEYKMMVKNTNQNSHSIIIPSSGWYQINTDCSIYEYNDNNGYWNQDGRQRVAGLLGDGNICDLRCSALEFQVVKGANPAGNIMIYSVNNGLPMIPLDFDDHEERGTVIFNKTDTGMKAQPTDSFMRFAHNNETALVRNLSGYDTSDFVCGLRWGEQIASWAWGGDGRDSNCCPERKIQQPATLALPKTGSHGVGDKDDVDYWKLYWCDGRQNFRSTYTYGESTAQALVKEDSYSNFEGYNLGQLTYNDDGLQSMTVNAGTLNATEYPGQQDNSCHSYSKRQGYGKVSTCVWLEAGDILNLCLLTPYNSNKFRRHPTMFRSTKWQDKGWDGPIDVGAWGSFEIGLINTDENWRPSESSPVISNSINMQKDRLTDINKCLPAMKCNDYLNTFMQTFNVRLTQLNKNTYSLDLNSAENKNGEIINIDDFVNLNEVKYERLTLPSTINLKWKIDTNEEGYTNGNASAWMSEEDKNFNYNKPQHRGEKTFENPLNTSGTTTKKESNFSYNWYKDIKFGNNPQGGDYIARVPVIAETNIWGDTYSAESAQSEKFYTDKTMRLFYINNSEIDVNGTKRVLKTVDFSDTTKTWLKLILPSNWISTYKGDGTEFRFMLDYDNSLDNIREGDTTMTDKLFNININNSYQITLECAMPNDVFSKIKANTLIEVNGGLYQISEISKHDLSGQKATELVLVSL